MGAAALQSLYILQADKSSVKLITSFVLSYPLAGLLKRVPDAKPALKNLFIISYVALDLSSVFFTNHPQCL